MEIKVGTDILYLSRFHQSLAKYPRKFKRDIFCQSELKNQDAERLAGIFSAKESVVKALDLKAGSWKLIEILNLKSGKPFVRLNQKLNPKNIESCDLSISHHGDYVISVAVFLVR